MPKIPRTTGREAITAFKKAGFEVVRVNGSHHIMKKKDRRFRLSVPVHAGKTLGTGLLKSLIKTAGLTVDEFIKLL